MSAFPAESGRISEKTGMVPVNWRAMETEELGSVYESLLELQPQLGDDGKTLTFASEATEQKGNQRKTTGSYYTPDSLVQCLMDSALDPVVEERLKGKIGSAAEEALLSIKVCDPAVGSGHFLIGAAHRLAQRLAEIRAGEEALSPDVQRHALRDVVSRCLYGVDINPLSVELCKVSLWMLALEPGKPLGFLDHHIQCGNSLLGATPRVLDDGLPDDAFKPIAGDDKAFCAESKKRNKSERQQLALFHGTETKPWETLGNLPAAMLAVGSMNDDTADGLQRKEQRYAELVRSASYENARFLTDAWCAAFVWKKCQPADGGFDYAITNDVLRKIERNPHDCAPWMREEIERLRDRYQFFHWHLAFPEVFSEPERGERPANEHAGWNGGFDVMLGNPPWERVKLQEKEWFAERRPDIADAPSAAARKRLIASLAESDPALYAAFGEAARQAEGESHILRDSGNFPLCGCGDVNLYAVFAEAMRQHLAPAGLMGAVLPSGIATDDTTKFFFQDVIGRKSLVAFFDFENKLGIFSAVAPVVKFCLFVSGGGIQPMAPEAEFFFFAHKVEELSDTNRRFTLSTDEISLVNPNTQTCPIFRTRRDAELTKEVYRRVPVLIRGASAEGNPWGLAFSRMFDMSNDSNLFRTREHLEADGWKLQGNIFCCEDSVSYLPLYEAKLFHHFNHRPGTFDGVPEADRFKMKAATVAATHEQLARPDFAILPRFWVSATDVDAACDGYRGLGWFVAFRGMTNVMTNSRNAIFTALPRVAVGNSAPVCLLRESSLGFAFFAAADSFVFDYITRQKLAGGNLNFFIVEQLPMLPPATYAEPCAWAGQPAVTLRDWLLPRVLELTYTAWDLEPFARDSGWFGPPFVWDAARRFQLRCELDAAFLHLYGLSRADAAYILDTFPIVRRKDEAAHGTYRTRDTILALYDQFADCAAAQSAFVSPLDPPPATLAAAHRWSWRELPMEPPAAHREPLPLAWQYVVTVMTELVLQAGGSVPWATLRMATDLLADRKKLARLAEPHFGKVARDWLALKGDRFDATHRYDQLSGLCHAGRMRVVQQDAELMVELLNLDQHLDLPKFVSMRASLWRWQTRWPRPRWMPLPRRRRNKLRPSCPCKP